VTPALLDISRLVSRVGRGAMTGIDRVELAYFRRFLELDGGVFFLCRLPRSFAVLTREEGKIIYNKINGLDPWSSSITRRLVLYRSPPETRQAVANIWALASRKCWETGLTRCLCNLFPTGVRYYNVGHSNLRESVLSAVECHENSKINVLIHDIIPLTYPEYSRPEVTQRFRGDMARVSRYANLVIYNSGETRSAAEDLFSGMGRVPEGVVAHLGVGTDGKTDESPFLKADEKPNFVSLGTIEPRKNHALLLDIWGGFKRDLAKESVPTLHIIGGRGWNNQRIFNILDDEDNVLYNVYEHNSLSDEAAQRLLARSWGLLFPSFAEGFGLPLLEAARLGVPVFCGENAIYRELLGNYPLYLNVDNSYLWSKRILERAGRKRESEADRQKRAQSVSLPDWDAHFDRIFRFT